MANSSPLKDSWLIESESTAVCRCAQTIGGRFGDTIYARTERAAVWDCLMTANAIMEPVRLYQYRENSTLKLIGKALPSMNLARKAGKLFGPFVFWRADEDGYLRETEEDLLLVSDNVKKECAPLTPGPDLKPQPRNNS